jgi:ABC-type polysaccharide/polyol phosphate export systems, permease component
MSGVLALQCRVIGALVLRETRSTFGTTQLGYLWAIIEPAAGMALMVLIFSMVGRQPPFGSSFALFFATGILVLRFFSKLSSSLMTVFDANKALLAYPVIKETDVLFARAILIAATYAVIMFALFAGLIWFGLADVPASLDNVLQAFAATFCLGFGFGTTNAVIISFWDSWKNIERILTRPLFFISGIFYVPSHLPPAAISILKWNPVLHCVEWMRTGFYANYDSIVIDRSYLIGVALALTLSGLLSERFTRQWRAKA